MQMTHHTKLMSKAVSYPNQYFMCKKLNVFLYTQIKKRETKLMFISFMLLIRHEALISYFSYNKGMSIIDCCEYSYQISIFFFHLKTFLGK